MSADRRRALGAGCLLFALGVSMPVGATPQWNSALSAGVAGVGGDATWEKTQFYGGVRGDVLFLRESPRSFGFGPALEIATAGFFDFRAAGGARALFPLGDLWGLAVEPAAYFRSSEAGTFPGLSARAWFGIQTYNYHGAYSPRGGLTLGYGHDLGNSNASSIIIAAEVDALFLALPFMLLYQSLRGGSED